jgi:hypothetical protein
LKLFGITVFLILFITKNFLLAESDLFHDILFLADDSFQDFSKFEFSSNSISSLQHKEYLVKINKTILYPLNILLKTFNGPNKLIEKRADKLVDYENALAVQDEYKTTGSMVVGQSFKEVILVLNFKFSFISNLKFF